MKMNLILNRRIKNNFLKIKIGRIYVITYLYKFSKILKVKKIIGLCISKRKNLNIQLKIISKKEGVFFTFFLNSPNILNILEKKVN